VLFPCQPLAKANKTVLPREINQAVGEIVSAFVEASRINSGSVGGWLGESSPITFHSIMYGYYDQRYHGGAE
jgi:hypothetical protein